MGLGPPVCTKCRVVHSFDPDREGRVWYCPICDNDEHDKCLWELDDFKEYERNTAALKKVKKLNKNATLEEIKEVIQNILEESKNE